MSPSPRWQASAAFRYGVSVFEGIRADRDRDGGVVLIGGARHLERLRASLRGMGMPDERPVETHIEEIRTAVAGAGIAFPFGVRIFAWVASEGILSSEVEYTYAVVDLAGYGPSHLPRLLMGAFPRHGAGALPPWIKSPSHYAHSRTALLAARERGADDVLFTDERGHVTECTRSSAIVVTGDRCLVPPLDGGVLDGVTRRTAALIAADAGIGWVEGSIAPAAVEQADSVLLASSSIGLRPAGSVNGRALPVSPAADLLLRRYRERAADLGQRGGNIVLASGSR